MILSDFAQVVVSTLFNIAFKKMIYKVDKVKRTTPFSEYRDGLDLVQANVGVTHYYYIKEDILGEVYKRTSYLGRGRVDSNGKPLLSQLALTSDDESIMMSFLSEASYIVYDELHKHTHGIKDSFHFYSGFEWAIPHPTLADTFIIPKDKFAKIDDALLPLGVSVPGSFFGVSDDAWVNIDTEEMKDVEFVNVQDFESNIRYTLWQKAYFSDDDEQLLDRSIFELFVRYVLWKWMQYNMPSEAQTFELDYERQFTTFRNRVNAQSGAVERSYHLF